MTDAITLGNPWPKIRDLLKERRDQTEKLRSLLPPTSEARVIADRLSELEAELFRLCPPMTEPLP